MTTLDELRAICHSLPSTLEGDSSNGQIGFSVPNKGKAKGYAWSWMERTHPKKARTVNQGVLAVRVPNLSAKELLLSSDAEKFFTEPHYNGYPAILVRLEKITPEELEELLTEAWKTVADKTLIAEYEACQATEEE